MFNFSWCNCVSVFRISCMNTVLVWATIQRNSFTKAGISNITLVFLVEILMTITKVQRFNNGCVIISHKQAMSYFTNPLLSPHSHNLYWNKEPIWSSDQTVSCESACSSKLSEKLILSAQPWSRTVRTQWDYAGNTFSHLYLVYLMDLYSFSQVHVRSG